MCSSISSREGFFLKEKNPRCWTRRFLLFWTRSSRIHSSRRRSVLRSSQPKKRIGFQRVRRFPMLRAFVHLLCCLQESNTFPCLLTSRNHGGQDLYDMCESPLRWELRLLLWIHYESRTLFAAYAATVSFSAPATAIIFETSSCDCARDVICPVIEHVLCTFVLIWNLWLNTVKETKGIVPISFSIRSDRKRGPTFFDVWITTVVQYCGFTRQEITVGSFSANIARFQLARTGQSKKFERY